MLASKLSVRLACSALIAQTLAACALIEPVASDAQQPEPDANAASDESEADGLSDLLASETGDQPRSLPSPSAPDAAAPRADAGQADVADAAASCEADWQCAATEYCSRVRSQCVARCDGEACLGPTISDSNDRLVGDGARVCFADDSEAPGSGDFALRIWDGVAPRAVTLTRAREVRALLLDAQYCYFHAAGALRRAALTGGCVELVQEMATPPSRIWSDAGHVSWSAAAGELYRVAPQQNARAERVAADASVASGENVYTTTATLGELLVQRNAAEGRLQATPTN